MSEALWSAWPVSAAVMRLSRFSELKTKNAATAAAAEEQKEVLPWEEADEQTHECHGHEHQGRAEVVAADDEADSEDDARDDGDHGVAEGRHLSIFAGQHGPSHTARQS